jgi:hypothetical protein
MVGLGVCMAVRDFDCILCQRHFSRMSADLILLNDLICDECLAELGQLEGDELRKRVSQHLARRALQDKELESRIVETVQCSSSARPSSER